MFFFIIIYFCCYTFATFIGHPAAYCRAAILHQLCNGFPHYHHVSVCSGVGRHPCQDSRGLGPRLHVGARTASPPQVPGSKPFC